MAERTRLELATPGVTGRYSNQLNYRSSLMFLTNHNLVFLTNDNISGGTDETRTRDPRRDRPVF
jgi:hypothetical protein